MVECEDRVVGKMYAKVAFQFMTKLVEVTVSCELTSVSLLLIR